MNYVINYVKKEKDKSIFEIIIFKFNDKNLKFLFRSNLFLESNYCRYYISNKYDIINEISEKEIKLRYKEKGVIDMRSFEPVKINDELTSYSNDDLFNINSWGADLSFRELIAMYDDEDLIKPDLQRKYIWKIDEASRLIDSILLGLPIPSIFLAKKDEKRLIIDGYQRIMTVYDYTRGIFSKNGKIFKLANSKIINERWRGKSFIELSEDEQRRIKNTTIHAIIFEQKKPDNDSGMYQIFERINTSGRTLYPQEIRNSVYHGNYNKLLMELNKNEIWRKILGCEEDPRMNDVEYILRFFAIKKLEFADEYKKNQLILKKFLNDNMALEKDISLDECEQYKQEFIDTITKVYDILGTTAFNNISYKTDKEGNNVFSDLFVNKFHPTIYEAVMISFNYALKNKENVDFNLAKIKNQHLDLLNDSNFKDSISTRTTNIDNIKLRITLATRYLFGIEYEWK